MNIKGIFEGIAAKMLTDFDQIQSQIDHAGDRGEDREETVKDFLAKYLPKKYALGSGQIIDRNGGISRQCDIVIYDAFNCPLLLVKEGYQLYPAESVLGVIEVKSIFGSSTIPECVRNIQSVKKLARSEPIAGFVFAFRSRYKNERKIESAAYALRRANRRIPCRERIDLACVLADGLLREYKTKPDWGDKGSNLEVWFDADPSNLLLFLYWLIELLEERSSSMPSLVRYASGGALGLVRQLPPIEDED